MSVTVCLSLPNSHLWTEDTSLSVPSFKIWTKCFFPTRRNTSSALLKRDSNSKTHFFARERRARNPKANVAASVFTRRTRSCAWARDTEIIHCLSSVPANFSVRCVLRRGMKIALKRAQSQTLRFGQMKGKYETRSRLSENKFKWKNIKIPRIPKKKRKSKEEKERKKTKEEKRKTHELLQWRQSKN